MQKKCFFIDFRIFFRIFPPYFRFFSSKKGEKHIDQFFEKLEKWEEHFLV